MSARRSRLRPRLHPAHEDMGSKSPPPKTTPEEELSLHLGTLNSLLRRSKADKRLRRGAELLPRIDELVRELDPKKKLIAHRRVFWKRYEDLDQMRPNLKLIETVSKFVTACCCYLQSLKKPEELDDIERFRELVIANEEGALLDRVQFRDLARLKKYCGKELRERIEEFENRKTPRDWEIWVAAVFHDMWSQHRLHGDLAVSRLVLGLKTFVECTEREKFVSQFRAAAPPHEDFTLKKIKERRQRCADAERKRQKRKTKESGQ